MGEISDMMQDGTLCAGCGVALTPTDLIYVYGTPDPREKGDYDWGIPVHCEDCGHIDPQFAQPT
jgi:hypothetical protein